MSTLDNLRTSARRWLNQVQAGDRDAIVRLQRAHPLASPPFTLRVVQHAIARERGFANWAALKASLSVAPVAAGRDQALTMLLDAASRADLATIERVLDVHPDLVSVRGRLRGHTGLRSALHFGVHDEATVRLLLERGADPDVRDEGDHAYPLHFAAERNDLAVVRLLIEHGGDPIGAGDLHGGLEVMGWATCFGAARPEVVEYLLAHGARHTLYSAVATGAVDAIRMLAAEGADLNAPMDRANQHRRPLHLAVAKRQAAAVEALIVLGAELDALDGAGLTPLDVAALAGEAAMAQWLLERGSRLTIPAAVGLGRDEDLSRLLGDDPDAVRPGRRYGTLPIRAAVLSPGRVIDRLVEAGASVTQDDPADTAIDGITGCTALHVAAWHGNTDAARALLRHGAYPDARDRRYWSTPAGWADHAGHPETRDVILEATRDLFDIVAFDRADLAARLLDRDPGAAARPFRAYATCPTEDRQTWPTPDTTPLQWAVARGAERVAALLVERGSAPGVADEPSVRAFLMYACWDTYVHGKGRYAMRSASALRLLRAHPELGRANAYAAIVCGEVDVVARQLADDPSFAREKGGPRGWEPLLYLACGRVDTPAARDGAMRIAELLLDHGADPNAYYQAYDTPYTVLVGVAGEGEQDALPHPRRDELYRLLLARGAGPFDVQVLYNTHFSGDVQWWLQATWDHTHAGDRGAAWSDPEWPMFDMGVYGSGARFLLNLAITKRNPDLARWVLERGASPNSSAPRDPRYSKRSLYEDAVRAGATEIATLLAEHGAVVTTPALDDREAFIDACLRLDERSVRAWLDRHPADRASPHALFDLVRRGRPDAVALLLAQGVSIDVTDHLRRTALHEAVAANARPVAELLVARGAAIDSRESTWGATPLGWATHFWNRALIDLLAPRSSDVWSLAYTGHVDRLRVVLEGDPALARSVNRQGQTLFWALPVDEPTALVVTDLLLAHGADASVRASDGSTASDHARELGMQAVARRLAPS